MDRIEFKLPDLGEGVAEGEIVQWHVAVGDSVVEDQPMLDVMTDKATVTIGAPHTGRIRELRGAVGAVIAVDSVLVVLDCARLSAGAHDSAGSPERAAGRGTETEPGDPLFGGADPLFAPGQAFDGSERAATAVGDLAEFVPAAAYFARGKALATPATRRLARELDVELGTVRGTGEDGRVTRDDVRSAALAGWSIPPRVATDPVLPRAITEPLHEPGFAELPDSSRLEDDESVERRPLMGMRRRIAERMQQSTRTAAHFTFVEECDVGRLQDLRMRLNANRGATRLTVLPFIAKAVTRALSRYPQLNSRLDEDSRELVTARHCHLGIAVAIEQGLMVPVVRNAESRSILELASEIDRLSEAARRGTIRGAEVTGSTFTISSLGAQGGLLATPILNYPEVGILGVHRIRERPVVKDGQIVIGRILNLSLSLDHRIVDGQIGAAFAYEVIRYLENPDELLIELR